MVKIKLHFQFFDSNAVIRAMDRGTYSALSKLGAVVRRTMKTLTRLKGGKGKGRLRVAPPGSPPLIHQGNLNRLIFFGFDSSKRTVVIGPLRFAQGTAPGALERGGTSVNSKGRTVKIRPHPFAVPALETNRSQIPAAFSNTVKSS